MRAGLGLGRLGIAGRLMAIVLLALLALIAAISTLGYLANTQRGEKDTWAVLPERAAAIVDLLDHADARQRALILKAINSETVIVSLLPTRPEPTGDMQRLPFVEWIVSQFLREVGSREVVANVVPDPQSGWWSFKVGRLRAFAREPLHVAVALADGHWIVFSTRVEISPGSLGLPPGFLIGAIGAVVGIASILAIAREAKPLEHLASSVARFGSDAVPQPVPSRGAPEIARLIEAFNDMQARIAALLKGRTILLGAVSHDLKTFITRLRLRAEMIADPEQQAKATRDLDDMTALIDDALTVARGSAVSERRQMVDVAALLASDIQDRPNGSVEFMRSRPAGLVLGDPIALRRLFDNLIDNAVQHAAKVIVTVSGQAGNTAVTIDDNGPGIPLAERAAVFEPFYRLDHSRSRGTGGSGLGLAIAQQIVQIHGGKIAVEASHLGGARIIVSLPSPGVYAGGV
ncbi:MAG: ATP-binding protein [Hyphomicrobiaceae bacterium]